MNSECNDSDCESVWPGLGVGSTKTWVIHRIRRVARFARFIRHLDILFPKGSVLYFEGTDSDIPEEVQKFMWARRPKKTLNLAPYDPEEPYRGWDCQEISIVHSKGLHMSLTEENLKALSVLIEKYGRGMRRYCCDALYVYKDETVLLQGNDVPLDPIYLSVDIPMADIEAFCRTVGCTYGNDEPDDEQSADGPGF